MTKVFVLDTSVILYDLNVLDSFHEHDVAIPFTVLEELDRFKKGNDVLSLHAREFLRRLDRLSEDHDLRHWLPLNGPSHGLVRVVAEESDVADLIPSQSRTNDHRILGAAHHLQRELVERPVILVTKDINRRVTARTLGLLAEDYESVRVESADLLSRGHTSLELDDALVERLYREQRLEAAAVFTEPPPANHYCVLRGPGKSALASYDHGSQSLRLIVKTPAYGITPRNAEQTFALDAIARPDLPLVTITGAAGTGKTLIALAGALEQRSNYRQIFLARPVVPLSNRDLGYLPGDINSKLAPYLQPLWDNVNVIKNQFPETSREYRRLIEMVELEKIQIIPLAYIRGRSLSHAIFIIDEAQNLTPHEVKTIITRAATGTKVVFTGDIFQIDTPYLDARSNGLSYLIDRMRNHPLYAQVNLEKGERSELANLASKLL